MDLHEASVPEECNQRLHLMFGVLDLADTYNQHISVAILSAVMHSSLPVTVHLLYDEQLHKDTPEYVENKQRYARLAEKYHLEILYHSFAPPEYIFQSKGVNNWNSAMYLRLFSPALLPDIDRVIYLDGDVVVNLDLAEVLEQPWWETYSLGACLNITLPDTRFYRKLMETQRSMGVPLDHYFNSGVLFMNLRRIRASYDLPKRTEEILRKYPDIPCPDQDILNIIFHDDVCILPNTYNNNSYREEGNDFTRTVIHYIGGGGKPWRDLSYAAAWEYWKYLSASPWGDSAEMYFSSLNRAIQSYPVDQVVLTGIIHPKAFLRNLVRRFVRELRGQKPER